MGTGKLTLRILRPVAEFKKDIRKILEMVYQRRSLMEKFNRVLKLIRSETTSTLLKLKQITTIEAPRLSRTRQTTRKTVIKHSVICWACTCQSVAGSHLLTT